VARFDRTIPPGGEGKITLRVDTTGYQGEIRQSAKVYTNDPSKNFEVLRIKAFVKAVIHLSPKYVYLRIEEVEVGREFRIHFTSLPGPAGTYRGFLKLKTNYPERPEITIRIKARFGKAG